MTDCAILGAGNWGTTLASVFARAGHRVTLWEYDKQQAARVSSERRNEKYLPGVDLPESLAISSDFSAAVANAQVIFLAIPTQSCRDVLRQLETVPKDCRVVSLMKGLEQETHARASEICESELAGFTGEQYAVLSGPTIAIEVARGLPTSATIAAASDETARFLQHEFTTANLRLYRSDDVVGVELAGAVKNVIALAAGICSGMELGFNTMGALLTRGLVEMSRLGEALGGNRLTFSGLTGMGDLATTCNSPQSRNRTVGERIGQGETLADILNSMVMVAEGVWTSRAVRDLAREHQLEMPITDAVCRVLFENQSPAEAVRDLMERRLKAED